MKNIVFFYLTVFFLSCQSQEIKKADIIGNWTPVYTNESADSYFECYISNDKIYYINYIGWLPAKKYSVENNILYIESLDPKGEFFVERKGEISIISDKLVIVSENKKETYERLKSSPNLKECIDGNFDADKLLDYVLKRQAKWKSND